MSYQQEPEPDGKCLYCEEPIPPDWDPAEGVASLWFCSARCAVEGWLSWAEVPTAFREFDPNLPRCGLDSIRVAEDWMKLHQYHPRPSRCGLLLHSVRSGTGKTRVATHLACQYMLLCWPGWKYEEYRLANFDGHSKGVWLNAHRFRQKYHRTMHFSKAAEREAWVEDLCRCRLLVLDEPDKLKPSAGVMEIIYSVLDERFANKRLTILTTNMSGKELARKWGPEYGPPLVRRIREFCLSINFDVQTTALSAPVSLPGSVETCSTASDPVSAEKGATELNPSLPTSGQNENS